MTLISPNGIRLSPIKRKKIAIIGYGAQGRAQALNLRDSGCEVTVGLRPRSRSFAKAKRDRIKAKPLSQALIGADVICFLAPDEAHAKIYQKWVRPQLRRGVTLVFAHGLSVAFKQVQPPKFVDVCLIAPKMTGHFFRRAYLKKEHVPSFIAVHQNFSGGAKRLALSYAQAIRCTKSGIYETTFYDEAVANLFSEQVIKCGGIPDLMKSAFDILVKGGVSPEVAYVECFSGFKTIMDVMAEQGVSGMLARVSPIAAHGGLTRGKRVINATVRRELKHILRDIKSGAFASEWLKASSKGKLKQLMKRSRKHPLDRTHKRIQSALGLKV